jgi:hypothetical protein
MMISSSFNFPANDIILFFLMVYIAFSLSIHPLMNTYPDSTLGYVNCAAINMGVYVSLLYADLHSFRYVLRSGIAGSYGSCTYSFLRNLHIDFIVAVLIYIPTNSG